VEQLCAFRKLLYNNILTSRVKGKKLLYNINNAIPDSRVISFTKLIITYQEIIQLNNLDLYDDLRDLTNLYS